LGIGLNVVVGFAGLLDLGYVAFFAIGAYSVGIFSSRSSPIAPDAHVSFWLLLLLAMVLAAVAGVLLGIPVLPLRGDYLAIVTLGFGEIIGVVLINASSLTNGVQGLYLVDKPTLGGVVLSDARAMYGLAVVVAFVGAFTAMRLLHSRVGRAWEAIREDEDVAEAMGINTTAYKLLAFGIGASLGGVGGAIFAVKLGAFTPNEFDLFVSINVLCLVIIGGMGSIPGVVMGSLVLLGLPDVLRSPPSTILVFHLPARVQSAVAQVSDYRLIAYGALLVLVVVLRPEGFLPSRRRRLEFREAAAAAAEEGVV
jgi:branched-chain amino acid transport system permease protein